MIVVGVSDGDPGVKINVPGGGFGAGVSCNVSDSTVLEERLALVVEGVNVDILNRENEISMQNTLKITHEEGGREEVEGEWEGEGVDTRVELSLAVEGEGELDSDEEIRVEVVAELELVLVVSTLDEGVLSTLDDVGVGVETLGLETASGTPRGRFVGVKVSF
jgi:hypothetical protein